MERVARQIPETRAGHDVLFMDELLRIYISWIKERIALNRLEMRTISLSELHRYVSALLLSHCARLSFEKTLRVIEIQCLSQYCMNFISNLRRKRKKKRLLFFNETDGGRLRLVVLGHDLKQQREVQQYALCGLREFLTILEVGEDIGRRTNEYIVM